ncbi:hypothetical protein CYMTET_16388 [Cymbomonas tetramitiformis]|uniref:Uncharacterized protein n=1 Tax=Cymbomonas tetramitiformis TaxID=36881 RepID=A0AAE0GDH8_9CHLO|nr:hypothetical protein CYMTET_16388 [Cymbomonas tetramitiformis]
MMRSVKKSITQPVVVAFWRLIFHIIDGHNRQRTGTVAMHDIWRTQSWEHRDFGELLTIIIVNAENAWKFFDAVGKEVMSLFRSDSKVNPRREFLHNLCYELIHNPYLTEADRLPSSEFVSGELASIGQDSGDGNTTGRGSTGSGSGVNEGNQPSKEHVPVTVEGHTSLESTSVASLLHKYCVPQPLPQGVQAKCGVPACYSLLTSKKGVQYYAPYKTAVKCGKCHLKEVDGTQVPAYVCSPLSGRTCWFEHLAYCEEHGHAHAIRVKKLKAPRKSEVYKDLSAVQRDIASGAALATVAVPTMKRRVGRPSGAKKRAKKTSPVEVEVAAAEVDTATNMETESAVDALLSLPQATA